MTGSTIAIFTGLTSSLYSMQANLLITNPSSGEELLKFTHDGEIYYKFKNEMVKVNCPEDVSEAFFWTVFGFTGKEPEDVIIDKYIQKISKNERSYEYLTKIDKEIRKLKLRKISK